MRLFPTLRYAASIILKANQKRSKFINIFRAYKIILSILFNSSYFKYCIKYTLYKFDF